MEMPGECEAIIVLGEALKEDCRMTSILEDRVKAAAELYHGKVAPKLIMSGGDPYRVGVTEAEMMRDYARSFDVLDAAILEERLSLDTAGNAWFTKTGILIPNDWRVIVMLTSDFKIPRAKMLFEHILGLEYHLEPYGIAHKLNPEDEKDRKRIEETLLENTPEHFLKGAIAGDDESNLRMILTKSGLYFDRPEYTELREQVGLPKI